MGVAEPTDRELVEDLAEDVNDGKLLLAWRDRGAKLVLRFLPSYRDARRTPLHYWREGYDTVLSSTRPASAVLTSSGALPRIAAW